MSRTPSKLARFTSANPASAFFRYSSQTSCGMKRRARAIPSGMTMRSSRSPIPGMKSGTRSLGLSAEITVSTMMAFAYQGIRGSFRAR